MNPTLIVIDVQQEFDDPAWGERNNPGAESKVAEALSAWRERGAPIIHVRHESPPDEGVFLAGTPGVDFKPEASPLPGEPVITKHVNSAFIGTDLEERLRADGVDAVAIIGRDGSTQWAQRVTASSTYASPRMARGLERF